MAFPYRSLLLSLPVLRGGSGAVAARDPGTSGRICGPAVGGYRPGGRWVERGGWMKGFLRSGWGIGILLGLYQCGMMAVTGFRPPIWVFLWNVAMVLLAIGLASYHGGRKRGIWWFGAGQAALAVLVATLINQTFLAFLGPQGSGPLLGTLLLRVGSVLAGAAVGALLGLPGAYIGQRAASSGKGGRSRSSR